MRTTSRMSTRIFFPGLLLLGIVAAFIFSVFGHEKQEEVSTVVEKGNPLPVEESSQDYRDELLDLAFGAATAIPVNPHIKDRSKAQEQVVAACLELDRPGRAADYTEKIENWRKGWGYAGLACYYARHGNAGAAQPFMDRAERVVQKEEDWQRDRIRVRIAEAYTWLGNHQHADRLEAGVIEVEAGKVERVEAMLADDGSFGEQVETLDANITKGDFDVVKHSLDAYVQLFDRFYENEKRRAVVEEKIKTSWETIPVPIRIDILDRLAVFALERSDIGKAEELTNEAQAFLDQYQWHLEHRLPLMAKVIKMRQRTGDQTRAKVGADAALALYNDQGETIVNILRAGALRPLAEAYRQLDDEDTALSVYKRAVEEGVVNPNSRPRAEDLSATCCSMALTGVEPDSELWSRMRQIYEALGQPW